METNPTDYRISFFKPTTQIALYNRNLVIWLVCIWFVAIFGFQILLKIVCKPTPEPVYLQYEQVWDQIAGGQASESEMQLFAQSCLSVLGKNFIAADEKSVLNNGLSWAVFQLCPDEEQGQLVNQIKSFEAKKALVTNITDPGLVKLKDELNEEASQYMGLSSTDLRIVLIANELNSKAFSSFTTESKSKMPEIMTKYLIHNQSFLTDFTFLGFPFHYFYTADLLLVLFVGLCLLYCVRIDRRNVILGIEE